MRTWCELGTYINPTFSQICKYRSKLAITSFSGLIYTIFFVMFDTTLIIITFEIIFGCRKMPIPQLEHILIKLYFKNIQLRPVASFQILLGGGKCPAKNFPAYINARIFFWKDFPKQRHTDPFWPFLPKYTTFLMQVTYPSFNRILRN